MSFDLPKPDGKTIEGLELSGMESSLVVYDDPERADEVGAKLGKPVKHAAMKGSPHKTISVIVLKSYAKGRHK